jgi:hypothetical protein
MRIHRAPNLRKTKPVKANPRAPRARKECRAFFVSQALMVDLPLCRSKSGSWSGFEVLKLTEACRHPGTCVGGSKPVRERAESGAKYLQKNLILWAERIIIGM